MKNVSHWVFWAGGIVVGMLSLASAYAFYNTGKSSGYANADDPIRLVIPVKIIKPTRGVERISTQPGSIQAYESVRVFSRVPGFLGKQYVDLGDRVKAGQILAEVNVPEVHTQVKRADAMLKQAKSRVAQMEARVTSVTAELDAAKATVTQSEAAAKSAAAWVRFRDKQYTRMKELFALKSIEERLVDESKERYEASIETERAAQAAILTSQANVIAFTAKIESAKADVNFAEAEVDVAQAELERFKVLRGFATITAEFDGVVTQRSLNPGDLVREGPNQEPLLTIERTDKMRVIVQIPDRDVRYTDKDDPALIEIDALGGKQYTGTVSRKASAEDLLTRLMRVEIDLPNPDRKLCSGMYGKVTIVLDKAPNQLSIPSACLVGKSENGYGTIYVVRESHATLIKVGLGIDNGLDVGITSGLNGNDHVIIQPSSILTEGAHVNPTELEDKSHQ